MSSIKKQSGVCENAVFADVVVPVGRPPYGAEETNRYAPPLGEPADTRNEGLTEREVLQ
ncbi:MAG: hypothetical protein IJA67_00735 [Oscillospiraceae bacterium]|nr:hypothetical protein [Oscillospiraceae bacterium]